MKILVLNWQDIKNPLGGGAEVHLHEIFKRLVARGHSVTLFCSSFSGAPKEETIDGIRVLRRGSRNLFNFIVPLMYQSRLRRERFDIVVDDINKIPFYSPLFVKGPLLAMVLHLFDKSIFREAVLPAALYVYGSERLALSVYKHTPIAVISDSTRDELVQHGFPEENITNVRIAVNHDLYRVLDTSKKSAAHVGYLGRIKKYKSVDHLIKAFEIVRKEIPDATLTVVGDGDALPLLKGLAKELGISEAVKFAGYVSPEEKVRLINQMHVVVNTSAKEGWGLTVTEANACGVPVVASDVPGLRDSVIDGKTGLLYEYGNIEQLAEKILLVLRDEHLRSRLAADAVEHSKTFQWDDCADRMMRVIERVAGSRSAG
ncbi:MAG: glycosyltransferase family 4 protein [Bacteroidota bacterium]